MNQSPFKNINNPNPNMLACENHILQPVQPYNLPAIGKKRKRGSKNDHYSSHNSKNLKVCKIENLENIQPNSTTFPFQNDQLIQKPSIEVSLNGQDLWKKFHDITNEMIVTKGGRRMFPILNVNIKNLEPNAMYSIVLDFKPSCSNKYKYVNNRWVKNGGNSQRNHNLNQNNSSWGSHSMQPSNVYVHPDSPNFGSHWMKDAVNFSKVKLTNKSTNMNSTSSNLKNSSVTQTTTSLSNIQKPCKNQSVLLNSLHKYHPRIHVIKIGGGNSNSSSSSTPSASGTTDENRENIFTATFDFTDFIAVTAYQNDNVTNMKIQHNPFAKAFLDAKERIEYNKSRGILDNHSHSSCHGRKTNDLGQGRSNFSNGNIGLVYQYSDNEMVVPEQSASYQNLPPIVYPPPTYQVLPLPGNIDTLVSPIINITDLPLTDPSMGLYENSAMAQVTSYSPWVQETPSHENQQIENQQISPYENQIQSDFQMVNPLIKIEAKPNENQNSSDYHSSFSNNCSLEITGAIENQQNEQANITSSTRSSSESNNELQNQELLQTTQNLEILPSNLRQSSYNSFGEIDNLLAPNSIDDCLSLFSANDGNNNNNGFLSGNEMDFFASSDPSQFDFY